MSRFSTAGHRRWGEADIHIFLETLESPEYESWGEGRDIGIGAAVGRGAQHGLFSLPQEEDAVFHIFLTLGK
ncbi:MAG TPA: hypothetical protein VJ646_03430 [Candidatus Binatia bacterium]|nr:hypothetical protein [Candidatus Binatia bacterium]